MNNKKFSPIGDNWDDFRKTIFSKEEIAASDLRVELLTELIKARQNKKISQQKLEQMSGVRQPVISRAEKGISDPQLSTLLKILVPLGKTLSITPIQSTIVEIKKMSIITKKNRDLAKQARL